MFVEHKSPGEVGQITKLSQAIRIGALTVPEQTNWGGCALSTAGQALGWNYFQHGVIELYELLHTRFGIDREKFTQISFDHSMGQSRLHIATELEAEGL